MLVLQACCEEDLTPMIGEWKGWRHCVVYRPGQMPKNDIIVLAQHLMQHGIVGKAKVRQLQRHETGERTTEFKAFDYISAARSHFGMNRTEASQLTMTEFQMLLAAKYPDQKGFTREEYDSIADEYLAKQAVRRENAKRSNRPSIQRYPENNKSSFSVAPVLFSVGCSFLPKGNRDMNKIFVALGFIALVITCTFAAREPLSLVFIIATFIIIGFGFENRREGGV
jgi:hypothetical protein